MEFTIMNKLHCCIDLETLDTSSHAVILSVGAVAFSTDKILDRKEWFLDPEQQIGQGRKIGYDTVKWWASQSDIAKSTVFNPAFKHSLTNFSAEFYSFFSRSCGENGLIWSNGADFDIPILTTLLKRNITTKDLPWKFWSSRCYRTVNAIYNCSKLVPFEGEKHGALNDSLHQARCLQALFKLRPEVEK